MDATITVRQAQVKDADAIAHVHVDSWRTSYAGIIDAQRLASLSIDRRADFWRNNLETPGESGVYVAETAAGAIVGFASYGPNRERNDAYQGEIYGLYLLKSFQRQGIGRRLVQAAVTDLRHAGKLSLLIWVLAANPARRFYEALGGVVVREQIVEIGDQLLPEVAYGWINTEDLASS